MTAVQPEEVREMVRLYKQGLGCTTIALKIGRPKITVWRWLNIAMTPVSQPPRPRCACCTILLAYGEPGDGVLCGECIEEGWQRVGQRWVREVLE